MYKDNSLVPSEAVRLAALGLLARAPRSYADLARDIRHITSRIAGPSLDLLGPSLELLKVEGLIDTEDSRPPHDAQFMRLAESGRSELHRLMTTQLRGPMGEVNKLIVALKLHFFDVLSVEDRRAQCEMLEESCEKELTRLLDLRQNQAGSMGANQGGHLIPWLDHDISEVEARRDWFRKLRASL